MSQLPKSTPIPEFKARNIPPILRHHPPSPIINIIVMFERLPPILVKISASSETGNWRGFPFSRVRADVAVSVDFGGDVGLLFGGLVFLGGEVGLGVSYFVVVDADLFGGFSAKGSPSRFLSFRT